MRQLTLDLDPQPPATFARFHPSERNAAAVAQLRGWLHDSATASSASLSFAPAVYLCGGEGSGKTHLLHAALHEWRALGWEVGWMDAASTGADFDPRWSAIIMDDVHLYDAAAQARAFNWFVNAMNPAGAGSAAHICPILCAGQLPPAHLRVREDLRTRLGWGLVLQLHPLGDADIRAALRQRAAERGLSLGDEVLEYMLGHFSRDMGSLVQLLQMLDDFSLEQKRPLTVPLLKAMLQSQ